MSQTIDVNKSTFDAEVLKSDIPVLVDFWAPWCGPCRMMAPVLDEIAKEFAGKIKVAKVNTEEPENVSLAIDYQIQSIPNMKLFVGGKVVQDFIGFRPKDVFAQDLNNFLQKMTTV